MARLQCRCNCCVGIGYSDDKLLQTRIFSYADTQRHRLGPNYLLLPVNAPKCPHHNNHHDGFMNFMHRDEEVGLPSLHLSCLDSAVCWSSPPASQAVCTDKCANWSALSVEGISLHFSRPAASWPTLILSC